MKKSGFFRGVLDGIRNTVGQQSSSGAKALIESEAEENLKPNHFKISTIVQHGFPYQPTSIAFDPIQRLIAIGSKNGSLRILGRPGVDISLRHVTEYSVLQIIFIINEGQLITVCADDSLHLWNLRNKSPEIVHSLKFQKERISYCHLAFQSKWLYIGTERGNVYVVNIETFSLSGYVINWNKTIEITRKTHPGSIIHLSDCPIDSNKLLIGYESGNIVLWDLRQKCADFRYNYPEGILSISWHSEGRQFICSHNDGSLSTWNLKAGSKPQSSIYPHAKTADPKSELCAKIPKVEWRTSRNGDAYIMFSGGLSISQQQQQDGGQNGVNSKQVLTVIHGKSTTVLEMEHDIIDFITLCESPYEADYNDPYAIVVLLSNDLVVVNLQQPGYPCFQNPYPMDLHESPVTYCYYLADCPPDLVHAFYTVGQKLNKRTGTMERDWPINGGEWGSSTVSYPEIIITGHADGSLKFWDASAVNLQILYKLKTAKLFEKPRLSSSTSPQPLLSTSSTNTSGSNNSGSSEIEDLFAIEYLTFNPENRVLCIAGASSQVIVFRFSKQEAQTEITVIEVPMNYDEIDPQQDSEILSGASALLYKPTEHDQSAYFPLKVRTGHHKRLSGFQAETVCISPWIDRKTPPYRITSMCYNMHASLLAYGTENSLVIIDLVQKSIVLNVSTASLYGTCDPFQRTRPKRCTSAGPHSAKDPEHNSSGTGEKSDMDRCRSPNPDNINDVYMSPIGAGSSGRNSLPQGSSGIGGSSGNVSALSGSTAATPSPAALAASRSKQAHSLVNTELKRSRSQGTRNKLQMMHTIHQSMMIMPSSSISATVDQHHQHDAAERLINSSSINHIGLHHYHHHHIGHVPLGSDKLDSFTRSRSSSMSSLENVGSESIQFLIYANTYVLKNDTAPSPTLWVGTSCGTVVVITLTMPDSMDNRILCLQTVLATPSPTIFRLKGSILNIGFLDLNGCALPLIPDSWKENTKRTDSSTPTSADSKRTGSLTISRTSSGGGSNQRSSKASPSSSNNDVKDSHLVVLTSEKQIRLIVMPQQICAQKTTITETSFAVRADLVYIKNQDAYCLAIYLGTGNIVVYSLPSLRVLVDRDFLPLTDVRIARTILFSVNGHGMYFSSPSELTKFTILASFSDNLPDMLGSVFTTPKELPEPPKQSFLKGFFGGTPTPLDREDLFGENNSGKAPKTMARLIPGSMEHSKAQTSAIGGEFAKLKEGFAERGERLNKLEDSTARMQTEAEAFSSMAHAVMLKYRDKKWYQF